ncbi:MAG: RNA polymerase subunit sigma [Sedimenticola sp.]|nr:MAG: RNA polymerase subunit sigma [Sedimenticola sp.]
MTILDPEAWLDEHGSALYSFALLNVRDSHRAEDLVQETLLSALKAKDNFQESSSVRTWLIGILKHKIIDEFRQQSRDATPDDPDHALELAEAKNAEDNFNESGHWSLPITDWGDSEKEFTRDQFWKFIENCLASQSPKMSRLFILREIWGMETDEVCKEMGISPTNLWTTLHRARLGMRKCLEKKLHH